MKGYAYLELGKSGYIEKPMPLCGSNDAIVKPTVIAACSSDVHNVHMGIAPPELILGHEGIGVITEVGSNVRDFKVGDAVIIPAVTPSWNTLECQNGIHQHSGGLLQGINLSNSSDGLFAEYCAIREADMNLAHMPEGMDPKSAVMIGDMVTTGFHGAELANISFGDTVVIIGIGPVGLMAVAGAKLQGAGKIIAIGTRPKCVEIAKINGATNIISYKEGDIVEQVLALTEGKGADCVIIAGGDHNALNQSVMMATPGGNIANINMFESFDPLQIDCAAWGFGMAHKTIKGGLCPGGRLRMEKLASMVMAGRIDPSNLITHEFHGIEGIEKAYKLMEEKPSDLIKPIIYLP